MINFINLSRFGFLSIIGLESLSWAGFLHFSLDFSWLGLIGTALLIWLILELYHKFYQALPDFIFLTAFFGVGLDAFSDMFRFYSQIMWWDRLMHFIGGGLIAILIFYIFKKPYLYTFFAVSFLGFLYEYWELLIDRYYFGFSRALGDGPDTVDDLLFNLLGAALVLIVIKLINKLDKKLRLE